MWGPSRRGFEGYFGVEVVEFSRAAQVLVERVLRLMGESGSSVSLDPQSPQPRLIRTGNVGLKDKSKFFSECLSRLLQPLTLQRSLNGA